MPGPFYIINPDTEEAIGPKNSVKECVDALSEFDEDSLDVLFVFTLFEDTTATIEIASLWFDGNSDDSDSDDEDDD